MLGLTFPLCLVICAQLYLAEMCHQQAELLVWVAEGHLKNLSMKKSTPRRALVSEIPLGWGDSIFTITTASSSNLEMPQSHF